MLNDDNYNELTEFVSGFLYVRIIFKSLYFKITTKLQDQKTLSVLNVNMEKMDNFFEIIHKTPEICVESWNINNDISDLEFNHMGKGIDAPSTITSYLVVLNSIEIGFNFLLKFSKLNSIGKWIFIFKDLASEQAEEFFTRAWENHKMINFLGILQKDNQFQFLIFNPFIPKPDGDGRGVFFYFKSNEWNNASFIIKNRLRNLYGYNIKVS